MQHSVAISATGGLLLLYLKD